MLVAFVNTFSSVSLLSQTHRVQGPAIDKLPNGTLQKVSAAAASKANRL